MDQVGWTLGGREGWREGEEGGEEQRVAPSLIVTLHTSFVWLPVTAKVTADGGINCVDNPGEQEEISAQLLLCEVVTSLLLLKAKGTLVLKTFTTFEHKTVCLMYLLACCFAEVKTTPEATCVYKSTVVYCLHFQHTPAANPSLVASPFSLSCSYTSSNPPPARQATQSSMWSAWATVGPIRSHRNWWNG